MNKSDQINELLTALSKAQSEIMPAVLDSYNPHFKSRFSSLKALQNSYREPLSKHGLSIVQFVEGDERKYSILTTLGHASGQWMSTVLPLILSKEDMQGLGSAISYARRYAISSVLGIVDADTEQEKGEQQLRATVMAKNAELGKTLDANMDRFPGPTPKQLDKAKAMGNGQTISVSNLAKVTAAEKLPNPSREEILNDIFQPSMYKVEFGKYTGKTLGELGPSQTQSYLDWVNGNMKKPWSKKITTFVDYAKMFLAAGP